jgi:tetratricopeptide (TPR) repeat protein
MQQKESAVQEESAVQALATPPLLGRDPRLWQALAEMRGDPAAAPSTLLQAVAASLGRKSINRILHYYRGVAALRRGDKENARAAWLSAKAAGLTTPWAVENLAYLLRERVLESAQAGRWEDVVNLASRLPAGIEDRILAETIGLAYYHLGYDAAQAGQWLTAANHWRKANEYTPSRYLAQNLALAEEALENWAQAAESWRDMVRRRPRKQDHPDYLTDAQIAAIWGHAAECYARVDNTTEEINCLKTALEYAPSDSALRLKLADVMHAAERGWAAQNELEQLLEKDPQNVDALLRLAALYDGSWGGDPESLWRRVLAIDPQNGEAREALAQHYIEKVRATTDNPMWPEKPPTFTSDYPLLLSLSRSDSEKIALLEEGLKELPEHPRLLLELGSLYARDSHKSALARQYLLRAYEAAPKDSRIASSALHELLHAKAGSVVEELLPQVRQIPGLLPAFWTNQAQMALHCKLGQNWIMRFFDEAIILAEQPWTQTTKAGQLIEAYVISYEEGAKDLAKQYEARIRNEVPGCGAVEYVEAHRLYHERHDLQGALRLIRKAKQIARKVNDAGVLAQAEETETMLSIGSMGLPDISAFLEQLDRQGLLPDFLDELDRKSRL